MPHKISARVVDALLDKLSSDDSFRSQFEADPRAALASLGDEEARSAAPGARGAWTCITVTKLASKEHIAASRKELHHQLSAAGVYSPFHLEAP
jgi:putative modified peptide